MDRVKAHTTIQRPTPPLQSKLAHPEHPRVLVGAVAGGAVGGTLVVVLLSLLLLRYVGRKRAALRIIPIPPPAAMLQKRDSKVSNSARRNSEQSSSVFSVAGAITICPSTVEAVVDGMSLTIAVDLLHRSLAHGGRLPEGGGGESGDYRNVSESKESSHHTSDVEVGGVQLPVEPPVTTQEVSLNQSRTPVGPMPEHPLGLAELRTQMNTLQEEFIRMRQQQIVYQETI